MQAQVRKILAHMRAAKPPCGSFADLLLKTKDPKTGRLLSDAQLCPEIAGLLFAGVDTTGHTGSFCL
jgi:cytochrome P450